MVYLIRLFLGVAMFSSVKLCTFQNVTSAKKRDSPPASTDAADDNEPASKRTRLEQQLCGGQDDGDQ